MADTLLTFQSQLSGVMETVFKAAIYEITRLVEDSFVDEVMRYREQVESLKRRLKWAESRRKERPEDRRERCVDCGRVSPDHDDMKPTEKSLKQENVLHEEAHSSQDTTEETLSEEIEDTKPETQSSTKAPQASDVQQEKNDRKLKEEALQSTSEVSESQEWNINTDDASSLSGPSKDFYEQSSKGHVNWETGFDPKPESSQDGHSGDSSEPLFQNRYHINELGGFDRTGQRDNNVIDVANFDGLRRSTHMTDDLTYVDQHDEDMEAPDGAEHQCYPTDSSQNRRVEESSSTESPLRTNNDGGREFSCLLIDEEGYLQDPNVQYPDRVSDSGSRMGFHGQGIQFNPSLDNTGNIYESSDTYSSTFNLGHRLQHQTTGSGGKGNSYNQCFISLPDAVSLKTYTQTHKGTELGPPYSCNQCGKTFAQACHLKVHQRIHSAQGLHLCSHCGKGFPSFVDLKTHKCCQTGDKPYCCTVCGNKFSRLWNLKLHQRIHTQEKPHRCNMCDKSFTRADILKVHQRTHTGERPYCCAVCGLSFKRLDHLKSHQRKHITNL